MLTLGLSDGALRHLFAALTEKPAKPAPLSDGALRYLLQK